MGLFLKKEKHDEHLFYVKCFIDFGNVNEKEGLYLERIFRMQARERDYMGLFLKKEQNIMNTRFMYKKLLLHNRTGF